MDGGLTIRCASWFLAIKQCAQLKETKRQIHVKIMLKRSDLPENTKKHN